MARRNPEPIITHTQTLCYAILHLENQIDDMKKRCEGKPNGEEFLKMYLDQFGPQIEALKEMYRIETGVEYVV